MAEKVLIITYYWPPAGGPGVQRWLKFVKYLPEYGIHPVVYIPDNPSYPLRDETLMSDIPSDVTILKQPIHEPYKLAELFFKKSSRTISSGVIAKKKKQSLVQRLMLYVRGNFFIPDARVGWVKPSVNYLTAYLEKHQITKVITTGPPHSLHLIGLQLKSARKITWIADFRDPWTTIGYHKKMKLNATSVLKHAVMEKQVLQTADHIIVTSENTKKEFALKTNQGITVITNGYDDVLEIKTVKDTQFTLAHIGSLLSERNPKALWSVIGQFIGSNADFKKHFILKLIGIVSDEVLQDIQKYIPKPNIELVGYINHNDAIIYQKQSQLLLLIEIDSEDTKAIIPGKLFEYMIANTPILAVGPKGSDVERIIKQTNTGHYFYYDDETALMTHLLASFSKFQDSVLTVEPIGLQQYSRKALTEKLSEVVKGLS